MGFSTRQNAKDKVVAMTTQLVAFRGASTNLMLIPRITVGFLKRFVKRKRMEAQFELRELEPEC